MDVQCSSCSKVITIPKEKVPDGPFSFVCPYCRDRVQVDPFLTDNGQGELSSVEPDAIHPGTKAALIFVADEDWRRGARNFFAGKGYYCVLPETSAIARLKLKLQHHDVILVQEGDDSEPLWEVIHAWRGLERRQRNVIMLGEGVDSLRSDQAFVRGVNACLALRDGDRKEDLLASCLKEHELLLLPWRLAREMESSD
ncbi:hypothetical protein [Desulfoplanes formicivorans]|uniref:Zinc finger/thioredoxin putative domain-containing protein n=1 Tax=Desulfoplanes formicivorans TaxID=1592317 RepID=A0A194AEV2_9BACT|nr:hypothetical protein [Desulfoplanes formicivorans]GAU07858.1 hypothetical protein DPF_0557 [Desulfoplanes formicivorans]